MSNLLVQNIKHTNNTTAISVDSSGRVTTPVTPAFSAYLTASVSYGSATTYQLVTWNATHFNTGNCYSTSTGKFTAPVTGIYQFNAHLYMYNTDSSNTAFYVNGSRIYRISGGVFASNVNPGASQGNMLHNLTAGDEVQIYAYASDACTIYHGGGGAVDITSYFSGYLIG
tara:strand:- start:514 stop:1023 length:510 start_codon:yes stop_codon:yes gene_type:complete